MAVDVVAILLKLEQVRQFVQGAEQASSAIGKVGTEAEKSGKKAKLGWKGLAKWAGGATAMYAAQRFVRGAVDTTEDLAKSTLALHRTTGMDVQTASEWAAVAKSRGIQARTLQVSFVKLSKEIEKSRTGTVKEATAMRGLNQQYRDTVETGGKKAPKALAALSKKMLSAHASGEKARKTLGDLGVSQAAIARGNTRQVLNEVADGLSKIENPARRAALAQQLFGRQGQTLLPILLKGRRGIQENLDVVRKYGDYLNVKSVGALKNMLAEEREQKIAWQGMQVQLGTALLPILMAVSKVITDVARAMQPLTKNALVFKLLLGTIVALFVAYKTAMMIATIQQMELNVAMVANPIGAVILAVTALIAVVYLLYKHWDQVKAGLVYLWNWLKTHWPLLVAILIGPFGIAALAIYKNLDKIKAAFRAFVGAIKGIFQGLIDFVKSMPGKIAGPLKKIPGAGKVLSAGGAAAGFVGGHFPFGAAGGTITHAGAAVVGEAGPELLSFPAGAKITPLAGAGAAGGFSGEIVIPLYLGEHEVARAVARVTANKLARR